MIMTPPFAVKCLHFAINKRKWHIKLPTYFFFFSSPLILHSSRALIGLDIVRPHHLFCVLYCFWSFGRSVGRLSAMAISTLYVLKLPVWSLLVLPGSALSCSAAAPCFIRVHEPKKENGMLSLCVARRQWWMWTESQH